MRFLSKFVVLGVIVALMSTGITAKACCLDNPEQRDLGAKLAAPSNPIQKLGRGISNIAFGALEIPIRIADTNAQCGAIKALTAGTLHGVVMFIARVGVGVVEVVTFPMPLPGATDDVRDSGWGYGPILTPEWVVDTEHNWQNLFYKDVPAAQF